MGNSKTGTKCEIHINKTCTTEDRSLKDEEMNNAIRSFRPASNWISVALISLFVLSFAVLAEGHTRPVADDTVLTEFCTGKNETTNRFFIRYF